MFFPGFFSRKFNRTAVRYEIMKSNKMSTKYDHSIIIIIIISHKQYVINDVYTEHLKLRKMVAIML